MSSLLELLDPELRATSLEVHLVAISAFHYHVKGRPVLSSGLCDPVHAALVVHLKPPLHSHTNSLTPTPRCIVE